MTVLGGRIDGTPVLGRTVPQIVRAFGTFFNASRTRRATYGLLRGRRCLGIQAWPNP